jgi:hypothetical protein
MKKTVLALLLLVFLLFPFASHSVDVTGSVTLANMRMSLATGGAFVDFGVAGVLTSRPNWVLTITDSAGKTAMGFVKAAGTGETMDTEVVVNGDMETGDPPANWNAGGNTTLAQQAGGESGNCMSVYNNTGSGGAASTNQTVTTVAGGLYVASRYVKSGTAGANASDFIIYKPGYAGVIAQSIGAVSTASWVQKSIKGTATAATAIVYFYKSAGADGTILVDTISMKRVLTPSATGVTIVSTRGGTTQSWTSIDAGFNYNDNYTYRLTAPPKGQYQTRMSFGF